MPADDWGTTRERVRRSDGERRAILVALLAHIAEQGYEVESQSDFEAVLVRRVRPLQGLLPWHHLVYLGLTVATGGLWLVVWILSVYFQSSPKRERSSMPVDEWGDVTLNQLGEVSNPELDGVVASVEMDFEDEWFLEVTLTSGRRHLFPLGPDEQRAHEVLADIEGKIGSPTETVRIRTGKGMVVQGADAASARIWEEARKATVTRGIDLATG